VGAYFHERGYRILCAGIRDSQPYAEADLKKPLLLVVGGEKRGISRSLLDAADGILRIDYARAFRGSLPTTAATAVLAFEILRQNPNE
jgi:23S rRNA (guanosine2251-2'-O)-methyltransferase